MMNPLFRQPLQMQALEPGHGVCSCSCSAALCSKSIWTAPYHGWQYCTDV